MITSLVEPQESSDIRYGCTFYAENGSLVGVHSDPDESATMEPLGNEIFKVKAYTGVKFEICVNRVKNIPRLT